MELAFDPHWSVKFEYLHLDFGGNVSGLAPFPGFVGLHSHSADLKDTDLVRVGINYLWF
jgi:hypothetical protein